MLERIKDAAYIKVQQHIIGKYGETKEAYAIVREIFAAIKEAKTVQEVQEIVRKALSI